MLHSLTHVLGPLALVLVGAGFALTQAQTARPLFVPDEMTVAGIHAAFAAGKLTCTDLVRSYLNRIEAYDDRGPALNAILSLNPRAMATAAQMDARYASGKSTAGPLHCIPVVLKDNYDTADMPTTGGSITLAKSVPLRDAFVVKRLRDAGALILAKANLTELARGGNTVSSLGGQTRNPYDLTRTPGGSSGGTGAAIAANFAVLGTGSDTGQSIRSPASAQSLVGIRPTRGLVSRAGIIPVSSTQDEGGPITRTVEDAARMLDVIAGYDPTDEITAFSFGKIPDSYTKYLDRAGLRGARLGVLTDFFGKDAVHQEVTSVTEAGITKMMKSGASIVRINIPNLSELTTDLGLTTFEGQSAFNKYLTSLGPKAPVKSLQEFIAGGGYHASIRDALVADQKVVDGLADGEYKNRLLRRSDLRQAVMTVMAEQRLDAILYPHQRRLVASIGDEQLERNGVLSNSTGLPAITFPGGFSAITTSAPVGVPIGIELLGAEWSEPTLIKLAYSFEQVARVRRPPPSTPQLK